tara:strand:- start:14067 stop:14480 length:414 start_codon:yes stop_codon:yes gene_type:complete
MKYDKLLIVFLLVLLVFSCHGTKKIKNNTDDKEERVVISNDSLEYEIIIIDQGFSAYLISIAKPMWYYSESYYRTKNVFYVQEWNARVRQPFRYSTQLYEQQINYEASVDYGVEVNYKLFNYFKFVEYKYKVNFYGF